MEKKSLFPDKVFKGFARAGGQHCVVAEVGEDASVKALYVIRLQNRTFIKLPHSTETEELIEQHKAEAIADARQERVYHHNRANTNLPLGMETAFAVIKSQGDARVCLDNGVNVVDFGVVRRFSQWEEKRYLAAGVPVIDMDPVETDGRMLLAMFGPLPATDSMIRRLPEDGAPIKSFVSLPLLCMLSQHLGAKIANCLDRSDASYDEMGELQRSAFETFHISKD